VVAPVKDASALTDLTSAAKDANAEYVLKRLDQKRQEEGV